VVRDLSKEVWELSEDDPVDPQEVVSVELDDQDKCPRCHAQDSIVYQHRSIPGARSSLTTRGTCEKCGHEVPGPEKPSEMREMPEQRPLNDFGRRRKTW
jgi:hypothetical protein